jgi:hypothetical protein
MPSSPADAVAGGASGSAGVGAGRLTWYERKAPRLSMAQRLLRVLHMIDPKVITEILKANGITSRSTPVSNPHRPAVPGPEQIPAGSAGEALFG